MTMYILAQDLVTDKPATLSLCVVFAELGAEGLQRKRIKALHEENIFVLVRVLLSFCSSALSR